MSNNLRIVLTKTGQSLDYYSPQDIGLRLNRIVDDFQNPSRRAQEFSYTFQIPRTKNNDSIFEYANTKGRVKIFVGRTYECHVYNNDQLLLNGIIELDGVDEKNYQCLFYSQLTQLVDDFGTSTVSELVIGPVITVNGVDHPKNQEIFIAEHILADYADSDATDFQFPLIFYRTFYTPSTIASSPADQEQLAKDNAVRNNSEFYNQWFNSPYGSNFIYNHQIPPAFYLVSIIKAMFSSVGWELGGSWINQKDIKKIILPYNGGQVTQSNQQYDVNKYLPKIKMIDLFKSIIAAFNLYFTIDVTNKILVLESDPVLFYSNADTYDITTNVDADTVSKNSSLDYDAQILFKSTDNNVVFNTKNIGLSMLIPFYYGGGVDADILMSPLNVLGSAAVINQSPFDSNVSGAYLNGVSDTFNNKLSGTKKIESQFSQPAMNSMRLTAKQTVFGTNYTDVASTIITIPAITKQTTSDNQGYKFSPDVDSTFLENRPDSMQYAGNLTMLFYYGQAKYNYVANASLSTPDNFTGPFNSLAYINIATGGTLSSPTGKKVRIPFASPYKLMSVAERDVLFKRITGEIFKNDPSNYTTPDYFNVKGMESHALMMTYMMAGRTTGDYETTEFSLIFCEDDDLLFPTLYSKFHKAKYDNIAQGYVLTGKMRMNGSDWSAMQINQTVKYNDELFRLVSIKNYDPINRYADITLLRKL